MKRSSSVDAKKRDELDLGRKQARELEALDASHQLEIEQLKVAQAAARRALQQQHVRQLVDLWQAQGRTLGPWAQPVLEGELPRAFPKEGKVGHG